MCGDIWNEAYAACEANVAPCPCCSLLGKRADNKPDKSPPPDPKLDDGGPAYPCNPNVLEIDQDGKVRAVDYPRMSLRDWFAGLAMQSIINGLAYCVSDPKVDERPDYSACPPGFKGADTVGEETACQSYAYADAMLAETDKRAKNSKA
jgi:hypothetical protein